jgi:hypothetical protein
MEGTQFRSIRLIALTCMALLCAGLIACMGYWSTQPSCQTDERAMAGEVKRRPDGTLMYFDGRCWTNKPMPPRDTPFQ